MRRLLLTRTVYVAVAACFALIPTGCGKPVADVMRSVANRATDKESVADLVKETVIFFDRNKEECMWLVEEWSKMPDGVRREIEPDEFIGGRGARALREAFRKLGQGNINALIADHRDEALVISNLNRMQAAERVICFAQFRPGPYGALPSPESVSHSLTTYLAARSAVTRSFEVTDEDRKAKLAVYMDKIQKDLEKVKDVDETEFDELTSTPMAKPSLIGPAELSEPERAATELVALLLAEGPGAWRARFATGSAWSRLDPVRQANELIARVGPAEAATWTLQRAAPELGEDTVVFGIEHASGFDDAIQLRLVQEDGAWRISAFAARADLLARFGSDAEIESWRELVRLKRALAAGDAHELQGLLDTNVQSALPTAEVARLWKAQWQLDQFDLAGAEKTLAGSEDSNRGLARLLRARLSLLRGDFNALESAYTEAMLNGIDHDGLRLEAALAFDTVGLESQSDYWLREVGDRGTRLSTVYYGIARQHALNERAKDAEDVFLLGWQLLPVERRELFEDPVLAWLATRPRVVEALVVSSPTEPAVRRSKTAPQLSLPDRSSVATSGDTLYVRIAGAELMIPGGAPAAPANAVVEPVSRRASRLREKALARLDILRGDPARRAIAMAHPEAATAVGLLASRRQWDRILELTQGIESMIDRVAPSVVKLRALALERRSRLDEARDLLLGLLQNNRTNERRDPGALFQLSSLLARAGDYDLAMRVVEKANLVSPLTSRPNRVKQIRLERDLAAASSLESRGAFQLRYPRVTGSARADKLATVLEAEYRRIQKWIPVSMKKSVGVDLYPQRDFMEAYGGAVSVIGLFDGRVRVPFADVPSLDPKLVSVLSHELAHAMIAAKTSDNAPKWFHEGLAQHVDMVQEIVNPVPDLRKTNRVLSLPIIEAILGGMAEPQYTGLAYDQAAWAIHFIESEFGVQGIHRLLDAYAQGVSTEDALEQALGLTLVEFDQRAWAWCETSAPAYWKTEVRRYDLELDSLLTASKPVPRKKSVPSQVRQSSARPKAAVSEATVRLWYRDYRKGVAGVSSVLATVLEMAYGKKAWDRGQYCQVLAREVAEARRERATLNSPDPKLNRALAAAYQGAERLAKSCAGGPTASTRELAAATVRGFEAARQAFAAYGLQP